MSALAFGDLEQFYDELAQAIDAAGPQGEQLFLAKLVVLMASEWGTLPRLLQMVAACLNESPPPDTSGHLF
ncbi:hypothetical protein JQ604_19690 [Bradyrhizobium jicamae]|uniref:hypothetical protein n=1 Tax=Bradyrhizobium jicamae TaxID=280332 RepID=UPI001BADFBBD|nr:hypothetical protein [Bradyrhizobium jicamae]MBR0754412.1 hypothetical protein [Bradyrhizobium jicamae]